MAGNSNLIKANKAKKDEFYTQLSDIKLYFAIVTIHMKVTFLNILFLILIS